MTVRPLRASLLAHFLLLAGCSVHHVSVSRVAVAPDALNSAKSWAYTIVKAFPAYQADPISRYEQPEILNVERDIVSMQDETNDAKFIEDIDLLKKDWGILVALDNVMQRESVI
jgi:hypothetical protein